MEHRNWDYWAAELEEALVSMCWHQPDLYLAETLRQIDPQVHFIQRHCQCLLEAVELCYCELNACDWHTVLCCLAEQGLLREVGEDKQLLDRIFRNPGHGSLFQFYINTLKAIAEQRGTDRAKSLVFFTGGKAELKWNHDKRSESAPACIGAGRIRGHSYAVRGWVSKDGSLLSLKFYPEG
jgi:hypothetical protein